MVEKKGSIGHMIWKMLLTGAFLAFLLFIAFSDGISPTDPKDLGGFSGFIYNFFGFIKAFLLKGPKGVSKGSPWAEHRVIPGYSKYGGETKINLIEFKKK